MVCGSVVLCVIITLQSNATALDVAKVNGQKEVCKAVLSPYQGSKVKDITISKLFIIFLRS